MVKINAGQATGTCFIQKRFLIDQSAELVEIFRPIP